MPGTHRFAGSVVAVPSLITAGRDRPRHCANCGYSVRSTALCVPRTLCPQCGRAALSLTRRRAIPRALFRGTAPVVVGCAAWTFLVLAGRAGFFAVVVLWLVLSGAVIAPVAAARWLHRPAISTLVLSVCMALDLAIIAATVVLVAVPTVAPY